MQLCAIKCLKTSDRYILLTDIISVNSFYSMLKCTLFLQRSAIIIFVSFWFFQMNLRRNMWQMFISVTPLIYTTFYACAHLGIGVLHPGGVGCRRVVRVALVVVKVKGLFAGSVVRVSRRAFDHGEEQLHVHLRRPAPLDELTAQPVTGRAVGLADLIGPHTVVLLIQTADLLPLRKRRTSVVITYSSHSVCCTCRVRRWSCRPHLRFGARVRRPLQIWRLCFSIHQDLYQTHKIKRCA